MCGRYYVEPEENAAEMQRILEDLNHRYPDSKLLPLMHLGEILPSQIAPVMANSKSLIARPFLMKWGYAAEHRPLIINARSESALEKPLFRESMQTRRCLIPANRYFEWQKTPEAKLKYAISLDQQPVFYMAGIYRLESGQELPSFVILTCDATEEINFIHPRMPVILPREQLVAWLDPTADVKNILAASQNKMVYQKSS